MWDDFNDEDVLLIKEKQKKIFDERVISLLEKYKSTFQKDISASLDYDGLCNHTVNGIISILTDEMPLGWKSEEIIRTELWDIGFTGEYLYGIKKAYKYGFMKGELNYNFINSPNRDYQSSDENLQIYVRSMSSFKNWIESLQSQQGETKTDKLKGELIKYGFFELSIVKQLSEPNKQSLIELLSTNNLPYCIAMFEYLGFLKHLKAKYFNSDKNLFKEVSNWFDVTDRAVKGNIYVLDDFSNENKARYTAHLQKQIVQRDYEKLK
jgi:hypothetical protein